MFASTSWKYNPTKCGDMVGHLTIIYSRFIHDFALKVRCRPLLSLCGSFAVRFGEAIGDPSGRYWHLDASSAACLDRHVGCREGTMAPELRWIDMDRVGTCQLVSSDPFRAPSESAFDFATRVLIAPIQLVEKCGCGHKPHHSHDPKNPWCLTA